MKLNFTLLSLGILLFIFSCDQKPNPIGTQPDFYKTDVSFLLNGISLNDTFNLDEYISVLGKPDSIKKGGIEIINEFGFDDYNLWYGKDWLSAGHGYLFNVKILDKKINLNGIYVGDDIQKINNTLSKFYGLDPRTPFYSFITRLILNDKNQKFSI